jgi:hypothetical protein
VQPVESSVPLGAFFAALFVVRRQGQDTRKLAHLQRRLKVADRIATECTDCLLTLAGLTGDDPADRITTAIQGINQRIMRLYSQVMALDARFAELFNAIVELMNDEPDLPDRWGELDPVKKAEMRDRIHTHAIVTRGELAGRLTQMMEVAGAILDRRG